MNLVDQTQNNGRQTAEEPTLVLNNNKNDAQKQYSTPRLVELGDLRALTFGSFVGGNDSGGLSSYDSGVPFPP